MTRIQRIKYIFRILFGVIVGLYIGMTLLLNTTFVQNRLGSFVAKELQHIFQTEVAIGHIDIGFFNRIIAENLLLKDRQGDELLKVARLSAKFDILPLFEKQLRISTVQLFGFNINLNKETPESIPNYQFVLDALASKDTTKSPSKLDLRINSVLINRGQVSYDVLSEPETPGKFNASHIGLKDLSASI